MNAKKKYDGQIYTKTGMKNNQEKKTVYLNIISTI